MAGGTTFADMLEEALDAAQEQPSRAESRYVYLPESAAPFVYVYSRGGARKASAATAASKATPGVAEAYGQPPAPAPAAPKPALSLRQKRAVDEMVALGAPLDGAFTVTDLRHAFRILAREYHPDRHPDCNPVDQARLTRLFAGLNDNYKCLLRLFDRK